MPDTLPRPNDTRRGHHRRNRYTYDRHGELVDLTDEVAPATVTAQPREQLQLGWGRR